jgi:preprotein translocase subunit SecD
MMHISRWKAGVAVAVNVAMIVGVLSLLGATLITTVFTAFTLTRLMVAWWVGWVRPQQLAIS